MPLPKSVWVLQKMVVCLLDKQPFFLPKQLPIMRLTQFQLPAMLLAATLFLTACGGKTEEQKAAEAAEEATKDAKVSLGDAADAMQKMAKEMEDNQGKKVEVVDFRQLKELLPNDAAGLARKEATGEKNGAMGMSVSQANGKYANADNSQTLNISIVDAGGTGALMGFAAWSMIDVDKETADGFERTTKIDGYKAYQEYKTSSKSGKVSVIVGNRFVVTADGDGLSMDAIQDAVKEIDLGKLADMK